MLLYKLLIRKGKFGAKKEIGKGIPMENIAAEQFVSRYLEVTSEFICSQPVKSLPSAGEFTQGLPWVRKLFSGQVAYGFDELQLCMYIQLVEFSHTLVTEIHLIHGRNITFKQTIPKRFLIEREQLYFQKVFESATF